MVQTSNEENLPEISWAQLDSFIDAFAHKCAAEYAVEDSFFNESIVSFKAAFQRPDVSAPSFSKTDFHKIIDALGRRLAGTLPMKVLAKASRDSGG